MPAKLLFRFAIGRLAAVLLFAAPVSLRGQSDSPLLLRQPALSATDICFTFAGDIWIVSRTGGAARRLSASPGTETDCKFSPDGRWVAYTSTANGNADAYVIAATGGIPRRLTWNPANDVVRGWTPDGKVIYMSDRKGIAITSALGAPRLFVQAVDGVMPEQIDLPTVWDGSFSPDTKRLAYMPYPNANQIWKRYRGGRTTPIWIASLADASIEKIPRDNSTDLSPMWVGDVVYFLSDRDGPTTLYSYDTKTKQVARAINNTGLDIKNASAGPGAIVYEQFGAIYLYNLTTGADAAVPIRLEGELTEAQRHWVAVSDKLQHSALSPSPRKRETRVISPGLWVRLSVSRVGHPTDRLSPTSPTPAAVTIWSSARKPDSLNRGRSSSATMTPTTISRSGHRMGNASVTAALAVSFGTPTSHPGR